MNLVKFRLSNWNNEMMSKPIDLFARSPVGLLTEKLANLFSDKLWNFRDV